MRAPCRSLAACLFLLGVACGFPEPEPESLQPHAFRLPPNTLVAHALGGIDGRNYTNSLEALESTLARGGRFFEVDLSFTADRNLVCFHTKHEKHLGLETPVTEVPTTEFLGYRYRDRYTLIDLETLIRTLLDHPDTYIVTDCKHDFNECMAEVLAVAQAVDPAFVGRIIPQFYTVDQWRDVARMEAAQGAFATVIFTLYNTKIDDDAVVETVKKRRIPVVTMSRKRFNPELVSRLSANGVDSLVHTVNTPKQMVGYAAQGVRGIYSDRFFTWEDVLSAAPPPRSPEKERP